MKMSTKMMVEAGVLIALAQILSYIKIYEAPFGGSVTAGSMVPILIFAIRWGMKPGLLAGAAYGVLQFFLGPKWSWHILSILLDYVLAFGLLGLAGMFRKNLVSVLGGVFLGIFGRFISSFLSGVILWASYAPEGMNPWFYSLVYQAQYLVPELIISWLLISFLYKPLREYLQP